MISSIIQVYDGFGVQKRSALDAVNTPLKTNTKNVDVVQQSLDLDHGVVQTEQKKPESATQPENAAQPLIDLIQSSESESMLMSARKIDMIIAEALRSEDSGHPIMKSPEVEKRKVLPPHVLVNGTVTSKRRPVTELEKARALQAASSLELVKPNVLVVMTKSHVYRGFLLVSSSILFANLLNLSLLVHVHVMLYYYVVCLRYTLMWHSIYDRFFVLLYKHLQ